MSSAGPSTLPERSADAAATADRSTWFSTLTYRSRSVAPMSELELHRLLRAAQIRNRAEGITGLVIYDSGRFFQWLEGPAEGLARVWDSVSRDPRHTGIEILGNQPTAQRFFGDWDLKLSNRGAQAGVQADIQADAKADAKADDTPRDNFDIPEELIDSLYLTPEAAPALLARLSPLALVPKQAAAATHRTQSALLSLVQTVVIPKLIGLHGRAAPGLAGPHPQVDELVRLLIAAEPDAAAALIAQLQARVGSIKPLFASVFEPAARSLGDLWQADDCSEFDVTLGLCRLQTAMRQICIGAARTALVLPPAVLVVPQPGEAHMLGAALDSELLWQAGWDTHAEFPATDGALDALLAGTWFDALDLSLSSAFRREHWLPRLAETIAHARTASRNPALVVVVGGRIFGEPGGTGLQVGADASCTSSAQIESLLLTALHKHR